eukprot:scaffold1102_cov256-Pinguiococcus_pyrenoidosus.AAC.19
MRLRIEGSDSRRSGPMVVHERQDTRRIGRQVVRHDVGLRSDHDEVARGRSSACNACNQIPLVAQAYVEASGDARSPRRAGVNLEHLGHQAADAVHRLFDRYFQVLGNQRAAAGGVRGHAILVAVAQSHAVEEHVEDPRGRVGDAQRHVDVAYGRELFEHDRDGLWPGGHVDAPGGLRVESYFISTRHDARTAWRVQDDLLLFLHFGRQLNIKGVDDCPIRALGLLHRGHNVCDHRRGACGN